MTCCARWVGESPRRSARPCSLTSTATSCSVWSTWLAIGTKAEIAPFLAVLGVTKHDRKPLRAKSPEPPMPLMMLLPATWVELTLP